MTRRLHIGGKETKAGFVGVQRTHAFDLFNDISRLELAGMPVSLNVIAEKPAT